MNLVGVIEYMQYHKVSAEVNHKFQPQRPQEGNLIVRTVAEGVSRTRSVQIKRKMRYGLEHGSGKERASGRVEGARRTEVGSQWKQRQDPVWGAAAQPSVGCCCGFWLPSSPFPPYCNSADADCGFFGGEPPLPCNFHVLLRPAT